MHNADSPCHIYRETSECNALPCHVFVGVPAAVTCSGAAPGLAKKAARHGNNKNNNNNNSHHLQQNTKLYLS
jgi:hypothetical protein